MDQMLLTSAYLFASVFFILSLSLVSPTHCIQAAR